MPAKPKPTAEPQFTGDDQFVLRFTSPRMDGLVVTLEGLCVGDLFDAEDLFYRPVATRAESRAQFEELCAFLAPRIVSWNWADKNGQPVPMTAEGLMGRDLPRVAHIFRTWLAEMSQVNIPLGDGSTSGAQIDLSQIPMGELSDPES